jgi:erythromycin esterase
MRALSLATFPALLLLASGACSKDAPTTVTTTPAVTTREVGAPLAWRASVEASGAYSVGTDHKTVHSGSAAGFLESVGVLIPGDTGVLYEQVAASAYRGKRVRLSGWLRATNVSGGSGFFFRVDSPGPLASYDGMVKRSVVGTTDWQSFSLVLDVAANAIGVEFGSWLGGTGNVLIDDLSLDIVGTDVPTTNEFTTPSAAEGSDSLSLIAAYHGAVGAPANLGFEQSIDALPLPATVAWLTQNSVSLASFDPGGSDADLAPLGNMIGGAHVFGMGEQTHGTNEFQLMKHRVFQYLVRNKGFTHFAIEATWPEANDVNTYVLTGAGDPKKLLSDLYFWTWNTQEVLDMILWMRQWNQTAAPDRQVQFLGFDMQFPGAAMDTVTNFVGRVDAQDAAVVQSRMACMVPYRNHGAILGQSATVYLKSELTDQNACRDGLQQVFDLLNADSVKFSAASSGALFANALHSVRVVQQFEDYYRTLNPETRDRYMAENAVWLLQQAKPGSKIMLWAHNEHISAAAPQMGSWLRNAFNDDYVNLGFLFGTGRFNAVGCPQTSPLQAGSSVVGNCQTMLVPKNSIEAVFGATNTPLLLLDTRLTAVGGVPGAAIAGPISMRSIGSGFTLGNDAAFFLNHIFPADFQLLLYISSSSPTFVLPFNP